jgi:hypothetical protein
LLWYPDFGKNMLERYETQGEILPTWSWSSVMGLSDQVNYQETAFYGTLAPWYQIDNLVSSSCSIAALNVHRCSRPDDDWQVYMAIASNEGYFGSVSLAFSLETHTFQTVREPSNP